MNSVASKASSETTTIVKNAGVGMVGHIFFVIARFGSSIIITRTIGSESYGIYVLAIAILSFFEIFALFGMENTIVKFVAQFKSRGDTPRLKGVMLWGLGLVFLISVLLTTGVFFTADLLSIHVFQKANLVPVLRIMVLALPFTTIGFVLAAALQGAQLIKLKVLIQRVQVPLIRFVLVGLAALMGYKLIGMVWVYVWVAVIGTFVAGFYMPRAFKGVFKKGPFLINKREITLFSAPLLFSGIFNRIIARADIVIMGCFLSSSMVGVYGASKRVLPLIAMPLSAVNVAFAPMISELDAQGKKEVLEYQLKTTTRHILILCLPVFALLVIFSQQVMGIFGHDFRYGYYAMVILGLGELANSATGPVGYLLMMTGRPMANLINSGVLCVASICLNFYLIPRYGILGAAWASVIAISTIQFLRLVEVRYFLKMHPYSRNTFKPILSCLLSVMFITFLFSLGIDKDNPLVIFIMSVAFLAVYVLFLYVFKLPEEDRLLLRKLKAKLSRKQDVQVRG